MNKPYRGGKDAKAYVIVPAVAGLITILRIVVFSDGSKLTARDVWVYSGFFIAFVIVLLRLASIVLRWTEITVDGVVVHFISGRTRLYRWSDFCFVGVGKIFIKSAMSPEYIICSTIPIKKFTSTWCDSHMNSVIIIEYTQERFEEFSELCPREIEWKLQAK